MKNVCLRVLSCIMVLLAFVGCSDDIFDRHAPLTGHKLRILAIGNSFTMDGISYIPQLMARAGLNRQELCIYSATMSGASIDDWLTVGESGKSITLQNDLYGIKMKKEGSMSTLLSQPWDVIVIQQSSDRSYQWQSYENLERFIAFLKNNCNYEGMHIAFQQVWSHTPDEDPDVYNGNVECSHRVAQMIGEEWVIPTGTAIQLARQTNLNDDMYLTRDYHHLNYGIARYIASCTWFERLVYPVFGCSVLGNDARPNGTYTDDQISEAQQCAIQATLTPLAEIMPINSF